MVGRRKKRNTLVSEHVLAFWAVTIRDVAGVESGLTVHGFSEFSGGGLVSDALDCDCNCRDKPWGVPDEPPELVFGEPVLSYTPQRIDTCREHLRKNRFYPTAGARITRQLCSVSCALWTRALDKRVIFRDSTFSSARPQVSPPNTSRHAILPRQTQPPHSKLHVDHYRHQYCAVMEHKREEKPSDKRLT